MMSIETDKPPRTNYKLGPISKSSTISKNDNKEDTLTLKNRRQAKVLKDIINLLICLISRVYWLLLKNFIKQPQLWTVIALCGIMLLSTNFIASKLLNSYSFDYTENRLYTISESTKKVLTGIKEAIDIRVYFSEKLGETAPNYKRYYNRVRALLEQYSNISGGKLRLWFIEPQSFSDSEDRAVAAGLQSLRLNEIGDQVFFGLVATNSTDQQEIIQFFAPQRERYLEYDITKIVHKLSSPEKYSIGLLTGLPVMGGISSPEFPGQKPREIPKWEIINHLEEFFEVKNIDPKAGKIDPEIDILMLLQPKGVSEQTAYAIDQFALKGKSIIAFLDPMPDVGLSLNSVSSNNIFDPQIVNLLKTWGVKIDSNKVVGDIQLARRVQTSGPTSLITEYVTWLSVKGPLISDEDVISDGIKTINFSSAGFLKSIEGTNVKLRPLVQTTQDAMQISTQKMLGQIDPVGLLRDYRPGGKQLVLAARLSGNIKTAFPNRKTKLSSGIEQANDEKEAKQKRQLNERLKSGNLNAVIVADTDFLYDDFWLQIAQFLGQRIQQPTAHNASFVFNSLENLSGGAALSGLRSRGVDDRRFITIDRIRRKAEQRYRNGESRLKSKLEEIRSKLTKVEQRTKEGGLVLSGEEKKAIEEFRSQMLITRKELRDLQHEMRSDIESLEDWLKFINIAVVPLLFSFGGMAFFTMRRRKHSYHTN
ncbi:MAG: hypothetical protein TECD_00834 [Hyphomicrobiaceae bacterium hypho_1]